VPVDDQLLSHRRADESGRPGEKYAHGMLLNELSARILGDAALRVKS